MASSPLSRSHLSNIADNLAYFSSLTLSRLPSSSTLQLSAAPSPFTCCTATAGNRTAQAAEPSPRTSLPIAPRQAFIPLLAKDEHGNFNFQVPSNAVPTAPKSVKPGDIVPFQPQSQQQLKQRASFPSTRPKKGPTPMPKFSKAARRFYNERFRQPQRLSKVLAAAGVASRRASEDVIFGGRVTVNGTVCTVPQTMVDPLKDTIYIDGSSLSRKLAPKLYFVLNKPKGYICSSSDTEPKSVLTLLDDYMKIWAQRNSGLPKPRLFTVGRLDVATTGLIFITNDGDFAFSVSHPSSGLTKEYIATVGHKVTKRQLQAIVDGTDVQGARCIPDAVEIVDAEQGDKKSRLRIVVSEGRHHEVRQLVENAGLEVNALKRVRIGGYRIPRTLGIGKHLLLSEAELKKAKLIMDKKKE